MHEQQGTTASKYIRTCVHCDIEFEVKKGHRFAGHCSNSCYQAVWYAKNKDKHAAYVRAWRKRNPGKHAEYKKAWKARNREKVLAEKREWKSKKSAAWYMLNAAKVRARAKGLPFSISIDDIVVPETCPYLGIPLERKTGKGPSPNSPSLDRIIGSEGYIPSNIQVISTKANTMKNNATPETLVAFAKAILKQFDN